MSACKLQKSLRMGSFETNSAAKRGSKGNAGGVGEVIGEGCWGGSYLERARKGFKGSRRGKVVVIALGVPQNASFRREAEISY